VNFFRTKAGSLIAITFIHGLAFMLITLLNLSGFFVKNLYRGLFHIGSGKILDFHPFVKFLTKTPLFDATGFTFLNWYNQYFYTWLIVSITFSLFFSLVCYLVCNSKDSIGVNMRPKWVAFSVVLLLINLIGGVIWTPLLNSFSSLIFTWFIYFLVGFGFFYISTFLFCNFVAYGSYIKLKFE